MCHEYLLPSSLPSLRRLQKMMIGGVELDLNLEPQVALELLVPTARRREV